MKRSLAIITALLLIYGCKKTCNGNCGTNYTCNNGECQCQQWYGGADCSVKFNQKLVGTYVGTLYTNGVNPKPDTLIFSDSGEPANYVWNTNSTVNIVNNIDSTIDLLLLTDSTRGNCLLSYVTPESIRSINCGVFQTTNNGSILSLSYSPLIRNTGVPDSTLIYTYTGRKM
jgi:hypothetical protein